MKVDIEYILGTNFQHVKWKRERMSTEKKKNDQLYVDTINNKLHSLDN